MNSVHRATIRRAFVPLVTLLAVSVPASAQTNFSGVWAERIHEDSYERSGGPPLGDYQGHPAQRCRSHEGRQPRPFGVEPAGVSVSTAFRPVSVESVGQRADLGGNRSDRANAHGASRRVFAIVGAADL